MLVLGSFKVSMFIKQSSLYEMLLTTKARVCIASLNGHTLRWDEKPAVIEKGETQYCI